MNNMKFEDKSEAIYTTINDECTITTENDAKSEVPAVNQQQTQVNCIDSLSDLGRYTWDDIGNGYLFADTFKEIYRYVEETDMWYYFNGRVWIADVKNIKGEKLAKQLVRKMNLRAWDIKDYRECGEYRQFATKMTSNRSRKYMIISARSVYNLELAEFDRNQYLFNCQNGTLNLRTMKFSQHRASDFISMISNVIFNIGAKCERFESFINEIMQNDDDKARFLQKALGYALSGDTSMECFFILYGKSTRNGKGTLCETIRQLMGQYARTAQPDTFGKKQFNNDGSGPTEDIARLKGARFINISEPESGKNLNEALIKQLTGGDSITIRLLYHNSIEYKPQFKIFINCNHLPKVDDDTIFKSGRILVITYGMQSNWLMATLMGAICLCFVLAEL